MTFFLSDVDVIDQRQRNFRSTYLNSQIDGYTDVTSFEECWSGLHQRWPLLAWFFGALATLFPGTATAESDLSVARYEKDASRCRLIDLSLEGIVHSKQFVSLQSINTKINLNFHEFRYIRENSEIANLTMPSYVS